MTQKTKQKVAIVLSTIGYHWEEVVGAYKEFEKSGWDMQIFTVDGKKPHPDPTTIVKSSLGSLFGFGTPASIAPDTNLGKRVTAKLNDAQSVELMDTTEFDAIYLPGGHGCLFDLNTNETLHHKIEELYKKGAALSGVCHATSTFAFAKVDGQSIVKDRKLTGFPQALDEVLVKTNQIPSQFLPIPFSNDGTLINAGAKLGWTNRLCAVLNPTYTRFDGQFFTGMGPKAAAKTAKAVIKNG